MSIFGHTLATVLTSMSTSRVGPKEKGALLGLEHGIFSGVRVASPTVGMAIFKVGGAASVSLTCAAIVGGTLAPWMHVAWMKDKWTPKKKKD